LRHLLDLNSVARPGARGVRRYYGTLMTRPYLAFAVVVICVSTLLSCMPIQYDGTEILEVYHLQVDLSLRKGDWNEIIVVFDCGSSRNSATFKSNQISFCKGRFVDQIRLNGDKKLKLIKRGLLKNSVKYLNCQPGKVILMVDGKQRGLYQPTPTNDPSLLKCAVVWPETVSK
jgi:hypothetical protein